ncbi:MAG TPA: homoserine dehydrogenase [Desulfomonilaceae bacterium]|nr:homoserine dehydrogenase [Desulfomonilaceae bacterium]
MKEICIGLIGFGTIGSGVVKILEENKDVLDARVGLPLRLKRIADLDVTSDRGVRVDPSLLTTDVREILDDPEISIVLELVGGYEPARTFILEAFRQKKHVVTANKALLAVHGPEIFRAAHEARLDIAFEAAVAGGIPILRSLREGLVANRFEKVLAILNGTCNFILSAMDENPGVSFPDVLKQAQDLGYAEADPSLDIDGIDAAHKLVLVLSLTHGIRVPLKNIFVEGIRAIDPFDVVMAKEFSYKIKLLAVIISHGNTVEARLHPTMLPEHHPLARVDGVFNGIYLRGDMVGEQLFYGRGAGKEPTASAVIGDIIETARNVAAGDAGRVPPLGYPENWKAPGGVMDIKEIMTNYYLRVQAMDRPGVLSKIAGIMAEHSISIHSVVQKRRHSSGTVPVVFLTHIAREADIQDACGKISRLDAVEGPLKIIRIEDETLD